MLMFPLAYNQTLNTKASLVCTLCIHFSSGPEVSYQSTPKSRFSLATLPLNPKPKPKDEPLTPNLSSSTLGAAQHGILPAKAM